MYSGLTLTMVLRYINRMLGTVIHEIENYFDQDYTIEAIGLGIQKNRENENIVEITDLIDNSMIELSEEVEVVGLNSETGKKYNAVKIRLGENGVRIPNKDLSETEEAVAAELTEVKVGDPNLWVNRKNLNYNV